MTIAVTVILVLLVLGCREMFIDWRDYCYEQRIKEERLKKGRRLRKRRRRQGTGVYGAQNEVTLGRWL